MPHTAPATDRDIIALPARVHHEDPAISHLRPLAQCDPGVGGRGLDLDVEVAIGVVGRDGEGVGDAGGGGGGVGDEVWGGGGGLGGCW